MNLVMDADWIAVAVAGWHQLLWERPLTMSDIRVERGVQDSPENRTL